ncbi:MAG: MCP four helix bundle domain-containing protein [Saprospiraceae bacterium]
MKWVFNIQPKIKIALFLAIICGLVLLNIFGERRNLSQLDHSVTSMYEDRVLPATYIFHLTDHLYQKRLILESYFQNKVNNNAIADLERIAVHNAAMDTLIEDFEATYLVELEDEVLHHFKKELQIYNQSEECFIKGCENGTIVQLDEAAMENLFTTAIKELTKLSQIQIDVSKAIRDDSRRMTANRTILTNMEALLVFVIAIIIQILIFASRSVRPKQPQQHEWN